LRIIIAILGAIAALIGVLIWLSLQSIKEGDRTEAPGFETALDAGTGIDAGLDGQTEGMAVDSLARIQAAELEEQVLRLREQLSALSEEVLAMRVEMQRISMAAIPPGLSYQPGAEGEGGLAGATGPSIDDYAGVVLIPDRRNVNTSITVPTPSFLEEFLGRPRERLSDRCDEMENPKLRDMLRLEEVGPIRVRMLEPAIESLRRVFEKVRAMDSSLYDRIDTAGSLCVRQIRGSIGRTSSHSFGLALDINIDGHLDVLADGKTQLGLLLMSDLFREEGWIWGAGFTREDSMHFEVSREMLEKWREDGRI
jgi:hypothetical protein